MDCNRRNFCQRCLKDVRYVPCDGAAESECKQKPWKTNVEIFQLHSLDVLLEYSQESIFGLRMFQNLEYGEDLYARGLELVQF